MKNIACLATSAFFLETKLLVYNVFYSVVLYCIEKPLPGGVWIVSEGVWMESECLGMY